MKIYKITLAALIFFQTSLFADELSWVDVQVDAIKPARVGIDSVEITQTQDPFIFYKKEPVTPKEQTHTKREPKIEKSAPALDAVVTSEAPKPMSLSAIINNSALIDREWYRVDQSVAGFKISSITRTSVVLSKGTQILVLTTNHQKKTLKFK